MFLMLSLYVIGIRGAREAVVREEHALARNKHVLLSASWLMVEALGRLIAKT
jgi:hypothetical protein